MMDRERNEKDLQEVFSLTQQSYWAAVDNTFALQERTLEFARSLLDSVAKVSQHQAESGHAILTELTEQSRRQREAMKNLVREASNAYADCAQDPFSHRRQHPEFEEAAKVPEVSPSGAQETWVSGNPKEEDPLPTGANQL